MSWSHKHILRLKDLDKDSIYTILEKGREFMEGLDRRPARSYEYLKGYTAANLFFEPSTRTRMSFELAQKRLGMEVLNFHATTSSLAKGETFVDTVQTIDAMNVDCIVIRHMKPGTPATAAEYSRASIINAGEGSHEHPTQALLDLMTLWLSGREISNLKVAIVGDILHSRVARSEIYGLQTLGAQVILVGPPPLLPVDLMQAGISHTDNLEDVLPEVDVLYLLRIQKERMAEAFIPDEEEYFKTYGLSLERLEATKDSCVVMHPGPVNRGVEVSHEVVSHSKSLILEQVRAGVALRMALLYLVLKG